MWFLEREQRVAYGDGLVFSEGGDREDGRRLSGVLFCFDEGLLAC